MDDVAAVLPRYESKKRRLRAAVLSFGLSSGVGLANMLKTWSSVSRIPVSRLFVSVAKLFIYNEKKLDL